jgi:hypothetical protein
MTKYNYNPNNLSDKDCRSLIEIKDLHQREIKQLENEYDNKRRNLENQVEYLTKELN